MDRPQESAPPPASQVLAIYQEHNKEKLHTVDEVLDKYAGRWGVMLQVSEKVEHETTIFCNF